MRFISWNLGRSASVSILSELVQVYDPDLLLLYELSPSPEKVLWELNRGRRGSLYYAVVKFTEANQKVWMFSRIERDRLASQKETRRDWTVRYKSPELGTINIMGVHLQSQLHWSIEDQAAHSVKLARHIREVEESTGSQLTLVCGDFNMQPFDNAMVQSTGLHAVMERNIAKKLSRVIDGERYYYFYNPMWSFLGDLGRGEVSGTFYYNSARPINHHWYLFDQLLLRPGLLDCFVDKSLAIITKIGDINLLTKQSLINRKISDHLPILFELNI